MLVLGLDGVACSLVNPLIHVFGESFVQEPLTTPQIGNNPKQSLKTLPILILLVPLPEVLDQHIHGFRLPLLRLGSVALVVGEVVLGVLGEVVHGLLGASRV